MKRAVWITLGTLVFLGVAIGAWVFFGGLTQKAANNDSLQPSGVERTDFTDSKEADVTIRDLSFKPPNIKIKKGTIVTWTNKDTVIHSVVADDAEEAGDLPTEANSLAENDTYKITFKQTGLFRYHSIPNDFMHGSVEVVD